MEGLFTDIGTWMGEIGPWAYVIAPLVMMVVSVLPIPAEAPAMANGLLFGPWIGTAMSWIGAMAGAWISYEVARRWGRPVAERVVGPGRLASADGMAEDAGWWGLLVLRFIPLVAFTALNWGGGLVGVPRWRFLWTTAVGILPGAFLFTSSGVGLGALYRMHPWAAAGVVVALSAALGLGWFRRRGRRAAIG